MGNGLNAFGMYRTEPPAEVPALDVGVEAKVSPPYECLLLKDRYYVKVEAYEGEISDAVGRELVEKIAAALQGSEELPAVFAALPSEGMVPGSAEYTRENVFGLSELDQVVSATYMDPEGTEYVTIVKLPATDGGVDAAWAGLAERWQETDFDGRPVLYREVPYEGFVGVMKGDEGLLGVAGCDDLDQLTERLSQLSP